MVENPIRGYLIFSRKNQKNLNLMDIVYCHSNENSLFLFQLFAVATSQKVQTMSLIFDNSFEHFDW